jgi:hypothetical protein
MQRSRRKFTGKPTIGLKLDPSGVFLALRLHYRQEEPHELHQPDG